jgi:predicted RNase H-like HicB family nuclease
MRYAIVIEQAKDKYSAYAPDFPGCVVTGATAAEVKTRIRAALRDTINSMIRQGVPVPRPTAVVDHVKP